IGFELAEEKLRVIVLDRQELGREASWAAAGMLSPAPDSARDLPLVQFALQSLQLYPRFVQAIEEESGKSCAYVREGALENFFATNAARECEERLRELRTLGIAAEAISADAARKMDGAISPSAGAALWLPEEGTVEPRVLMDALIAAAQKRGVEFRAGCEVRGLLREGGRCVGVVSDGGKFASEHVILAAGCFSGEISKEPWLKQLAPTHPVRGQMLALRPYKRDGGPRRVVRSELGYLVPRRDGRIVAGSTTEEAGFEKQVTAAGLRKIASAAIEMCPELGGAEVSETWSGLRPGTPDDLPILGATDMDGLWMATGHYRNGILLSAATATLFRELITGAKRSFDVE
ncbi:MAG: glycine oxidase ThiO, partial [Terracidiphilus sp.]